MSEKLQLKNYEVKQKCISHKHEILNFLNEVSWFKNSLKNREYNGMCIPSDAPEFSWKYDFQSCITDN